MCTLSLSRDLMKGENVKMKSVWRVCMWFVTVQVKHTAGLMRTPLWMQLSLVSARLRGVSHIHGMVNLMWLGMPFGRETLDYPGVPELDQTLEHAKAQRAATELLSVGPKCLVCIPSLPGLIIWIGGTNLIHKPYFFLCPLKHSSTWPKLLFKYISMETIWNKI